MKGQRPPKVVAVAMRRGGMWRIEKGWNILGDGLLVVVLRGFLICGPGVVFWLVVCELK
ncbi:hypothetical protein M7I_5466 [Glarea lozoyensis 74030]|uniref:Transmembrane protein n=1 Tax=Glarea lozoyensis (strain ATCC 74030 / MF5533) TaxID=1104152 RepID=H0ERZ4_GLAL7|nr:hypothetical protein M7I_5466 [Glarea lozoyensis 74030]